MVYIVCTFPQRL